jgi:glucose-6-phosphate isomerase
MISFHYANVTASRVGPDHGLSDAELDEAAARAGPLCARFAEDAEKGAHGFMRLPHDREAAAALGAFAKDLRGRFRNFVQVGIGGSALGATAIHTALSHRFHNETDARPRFYVLDNVDPEETRALFDVVEPRETLFHVVTKSGDTTETMAGLLVALRRLKDALGNEWKKNLVVTTDPKKGFLRKFARDEGVAAFDLAEAVGGRFSVLTPVGLLPAAMLGVDPGELLAGAAGMDARCRARDPKANPGFLFALVAHLLDTKRGKRIHVMMPYARALRDLGDWFRQLWAESLGKNPQVGPTPVLALGTTDQHSQVQLYNEGPNDKYVIFLECEKFRQGLTVPEVLAADAPPAFLQGKTFGQILSAMKSGTETALVQARRPNATLKFQELSAASLGAAFYLLEAATLFAGWLYGVNPFDQPGVEAGKKAAFALLGKPGFAAPPPAPADPKYSV